MDPLEAAFLFCFVFGLVMSGLSFLLGSFHGLGGGHANGAGHAGHVDVHLEAGAHHGGLDGAGPEGTAKLGHGPSPVNVNTITAFLAFFGGVGYVVYGALGLGPALALVLAVLAGLIGGAIVFFFLVRVLLAGQRFLDPSDFRLEGSVARVSQSIRADGIGEIVYARDGTRRSEGARSASGEAIPSGTEVVIVRYERGLAYVEPWKSYVGER